MSGEPPRSPEWPRVERVHLRRQPRCMCCKPGTNPRAGLQVHRIFPFHYCIALGRPDLELDDRNPITARAGGEGGVAAQGWTTVLP